MHIACTICAGNYLAYARVLAESFHAHHPDATFVVLLIDDEQPKLTPGEERIVWRRLRDLGIDEAEMRRLAAIYDVRELSTAVKPLLLRHLLDGGADAVMYLDPDIRIYGSLARVWDLAAQHGIVLTPHTTQPFPRDGSPVNSFYILAAGVYNLGFAAVGASARPFLDWWWQGTRRWALNDVSNMMFTDQRWIDFAPCFFEPHILKDPGYNVAYWNLHARALTLDGDRFAVDGEPLRFFHFSGYDVERPWLLSRHQGEQPRVLLSDRPPLRRLCSDYSAALQQAGIGGDAARRYGWGTLACGLQFTDAMRRLYRSALVAAEQRNEAGPPDPFDEARPDAFIAWLNSPDEAGPQRISRYLYQLFQSRIDLQMHFRDIFGADASSYLEWVRHDGVVQAYIPAELLPPAQAIEPSNNGEPMLEEGLNIAGYFRSELGIGEAARLLVRAVEAAGIPYSTITTATGALSRQAHDFGSHPEGVAAYDVNLVCVNADMTPQFARNMGRAFFEGRHTIGYWFWEVERFPPQLHAAFNEVDEVWAATDFVADAVRRAGRTPVFTVPVPLASPRQFPHITRERLGLPDGFVFLFSFDFLSVFERKNPLALVRAFTRAFEPGSGPRLVIKTINGYIRLNDVERLRAEIGDRPDIQLVDGYYTAAEKDALVGLCDCYVSLHRSEGLGLTMAEAMAAGKPVIATGYSGNMQFMTAANSFLVEHGLVRVPPGCGPYPEDAEWADPDLDHAAHLMRRVYEAPQEAAARGERARADLLQQHSAERSAAAITRRLEAIRRDRRSRIAVPAASPAAPPPSAPGATTGLEAALARLEALAAPQIIVDGRPFPAVRTAAQRGLFRLLRPFWFQHQQLHTDLLARLHQLARGLSEESEARAATERLLAHRLREESEARVATERRLAQLTSDVALATRDLTQLGQLSTRLQDRAGARIDSLEQTTTDMGARLAALARAAAKLDGLERGVGRTEQSLSTLEHRLFAVPYMTDPRHFLEVDEHGHERLGFSSPNGSRDSGFYVGFEDLFRGSQTLIRDRQAVYVPLLRQASHVVDIGCGRGEMLDLLGAANTPATGVDIDPDMVKICRAKGHSVEQIDAVKFLRDRGEGSLPAVFSAQVIEHLPFEQLKAFLTLCRSRLRPGGTMIVETVNPHALEAFKTFYTDLTHQRPIFPEVALALVQLAGFARARVVFPLGASSLMENRRTQGEYAVVATIEDDD